MKGAAPEGTAGSTGGEDGVGTHRRMINDRPSDCFKCKYVSRRALSCFKGPRHAIESYTPQLIDHYARRKSSKGDSSHLVSTDL